MAIASPAAQADDASFVRSVKALGFVQMTANLVSTAKSACNMLSYNNRNPAEIEARIQRYTLAKPPAAHQFFVLAVDEYCPQHTAAVGN
ncbi:hypothetical protein A5630_20890 [Mycolicibacterium mucogenicum]|uniref:DUF732 domain-containing protein n=2 Tax=Mycolicibacterium mucogenicum TaxID=56689 RepID=A0A1A3H2I1_MYCMU|nr:hypothetical protein A5630_20890 [Mycolicibacterium mucogenicum]